MSWLSKGLGLAAGAAGGASPWLLGGLFIGGLALGAAGAAWIQEYRIEGLQTSVASWEKLVQGDLGLEAQIKGLSTSLSQRNAEIKRLNDEMDRITADYQETQAATLELLDEAEARADATAKRAAADRRKADEAKDADKPKNLSPVARGAAEWGLCRAAAIAAGSDPTACQ